MSMLTKKYKSQEEAYATAGRGRYTKKEPPNPSVKDYVLGVQRPPPRRRSEQVAISSSKNARSLSVPSLWERVDHKIKESPPHSPAKPRSTSVRLNPRKALSFKKIYKKIFEFGSRSELEDGGHFRNDEQTVGIYRQLTNRPTSIGSDCSNSSYTDFTRCDSFRVSTHSRVSHGAMDSAFSHQQSCDSNDYISINHITSGSTDSNLRPISVAVMPRSSSSSSLKTYGLQPKPSDIGRHSIAAMPTHSTEVPPSSVFVGDDRLPPHRRPAARHTHRMQEEAESLWEDSQSFTYMNTPVLPSHPEYPQVAEELMTASPPRKNSTEITPPDFRRMSDTGSTVDPRRVSNDSGVESSKPSRSQPSTPVAQTLTSVRTEGTCSPEMHVSPHDYLSQGSSTSSLPPGWTSAISPQGLTYYLDHNTQTTHWKLPDDTTSDESTGLPSGWEIVQSSRYGTYYVNHNNKTAIYQHPYHSRPPPPYHRPPHSQDEDQWSARERRPPPRSHSYRDTQTHRVVDPNTSLPRRSKSFKDQETQDAMAAISHSKQLSTVTYVPPSPYQIAEIPPWLKEYVEAPLDHEMERSMAWNRYSYEDLNGVDTMIKRMMRKGLEQIVRQVEYYRASIDQELNSRGSSRVFHRRPINRQTRSLKPQPPQLQYPPNLSILHPSPYPPPPSSPHVRNHTPPLPLQPSHQPLQATPPNYKHPPQYSSNTTTIVTPSHPKWADNGRVNPQLPVYPTTSYSSSDHSTSSSRTLKAQLSDFDSLQDTEETLV